MYVDLGSGVYEDTMLKALVLHPKDLTYVEKDVFEHSLRSLIGVEDPNVESQLESQASTADLQVADLHVAESAAQVRPLLENVKKRRLYRRATGELVVCFRMTTTPTCSRRFFGNPVIPAGSCMARQPQAQASLAAWRWAWVSSLYVRMNTMSRILASR